MISKLKNGWVMLQQGAKNEKDLYSSVARITDTMVPIQIRIGPKTYKGVLIVDKHSVYVILNV